MLEKLKQQLEKLKSKSKQVEQQIDAIEGEAVLTKNGLQIGDLISFPYKGGREKGKIFKANKHEMIVYTFKKNGFITLKTVKVRFSERWEKLQ